MRKEAGRAGELWGRYSQGGGACTARAPPPPAHDWPLAAGGAAEGRAAFEQFGRVAPQCPCGTRVHIVIIADLRDGGEIRPLLNRRYVEASLAQGAGETVGLSPASVVVLDEDAGNHPDVEPILGSRRPVVRDRLIQRNDQAARRRDGDLRRRAVPSSGGRLRTHIFAPGFT